MTTQNRRKTVAADRASWAAIALPRRASWFLVAAAVAWGCTVYDNDLLTTHGGSTVGGTSAGKSASTGGSSSAAGKASAAGTFSNGGGSSGNANGGAGAGASPSDAGGEGGDGGASPSGGMGGSGGKAVSGGTGGTSGGGTGGTAGTAGSGGMGATPCAEHPLSAKATWEASAFHSSLGDGTEADGLYNPPEHMIDGKFNERWSSDGPQTGHEWVQINFGVVVTLTDLTLNVAGNVDDYPRAYEVRLSNDPTVDATALPGSPVLASGVGATGDTVIHFAPPITGQYLTVHQTGMNAVGVKSWWSITEVLVGCATP